MGEGRANQWFLGVMALIVSAAALMAAQGILAPFTFAIFTIAVVWPMHDRLRRALPDLLALLITLTVTLLVIGALAWMVVWGLTRVTTWLIANGARFQVIYGQLNAFLYRNDVVVADLWAQHFDVRWLTRLGQAVLAEVQGSLSFILVTLVFAMLGLLEVDLFARKLRHGALGTAGPRLAAACVQTARKFQRYMAVRTLMSVVTGVMVWGFAQLVGLDLALAWGVIAFALNYIPFLGPLISTLFPTLFAMAQFESWQMALIVFGVLNVVQFITGSYVEPRISGTALSVSPVLVLFAVFLFGFMWGMAGAFIGVPILIAAQTLCMQFPGARWMGVVLAEDAPPD
jgi:predicted PurR-regulated permease PerM